MRKIKEVLRLQFECGIKSRRQIAKATSCGKTAVTDYLRRAEIAQLRSWDQSVILSEEEIEARLYPEDILQKLQPKATRIIPDWSVIHHELKRRDHQMTLALLWQEYKEEHPSGYQYSWFAHSYQTWAKKLSISMRQAHIAGEKSFVDFCDGLFITDTVTGEKRKTHLFVGTLGASSYTFAYAVISQEVPQWLDCHVKMYEFFGGVTQITVPDNLLSGVTKPCRYEAGINESYRELSLHYGTCIIPARVRRPKDKGKVEAAVLVAQRWILAALRHRTFYSVKELNDAIAVLLLKLNQKKMRRLKKSRLELFLEIDRPALKALPSQRYEYAEWKKVRLNIDYHIEFEDHFYSAPYQLIREELWLRAGVETIEVFHRGKRVASHPRSYLKYKAATTPEHMPSTHRGHAEWTPSRIIEWAGSIGPMTSLFVKKVIESKQHPEQGYRSALGIIRLEKEHTKLRVEKACEKAIAIGSHSYRTVKTMLQNKMESAPINGEIRYRGGDQKSQQLDLLAALNIRGKDYYN